MDQTIQNRLAELQISLPQPPKPSGSYIPASVAGNLLFCSGQVPRVNGVVQYEGKMGEDGTMENAYAAARICAINCLAAIEAAVGLERVEKIVKVNGYVNTAPGFRSTPKCINGASDLFLAVFGDRGRHARSAVGVQTLPDNAIVEIEMIVLLKEEA